MAEHLANVGPDGRTAILSALQELEAVGYVVRSQSRGDAGTFDSIETVVFEEPKSGYVERGTKSQVGPSAAEKAQVKPQSGFPLTGNPLTENPRLVRTDLEKTEGRNENLVPHVQGHDGNDDLKTAEEAFALALLRLWPEMSFESRAHYLTRAVEKIEQSDGADESPQALLAAACRMETRADRIALRQSGPVESTEFSLGVVDQVIANFERGDGWIGSNNLIYE
jgi:hypothetical protein